MGDTILALWRLSSKIGAVSSSAVEREFPNSKLLCRRFCRERVGTGTASNLWRLVPEILYLIGQGAQWTPVAVATPWLLVRTRTVDWTLDWTWTYTRKNRRYPNGCRIDFNQGANNQSSHEASVVVVSRVWKLRSKTWCSSTRPLVGAQTEMRVILPQRSGFSPGLHWLEAYVEWLHDPEHSKYQSLCSCLHGLSRCLKESCQAIRIVSWLLALCWVLLSSLIFFLTLFSSRKGSRY